MRAILRTPDHRMEHEVVMEDAIMVIEVGVVIMEEEVVMEDEEGVVKEMELVMDKEDWRGRRFW